MKLTKRQFLGRLYGSAAALATTASLPRLLKPARAADALRLITWKGYAEDEAIKGFVDRTGVNVERIYVSSNDEYMAKLAAGGGDYDMVVVVTSLGQQAIKAGFLEPLDIEKLPNFQNLYPEFKTLRYYQHDGKTYGVPTYWGMVPMTFNAEAIPDRSDFDVLFDPQFKGRISMWDDISTLAQVARWMGMDNVWDLDDSQLALLKAKMIEQKPLVRKYWSQPGELIELFASGEVVAAISWDYVTLELLKAGHKVRQPPFKEAMGWADAHTIIAGTQKRDLAHQFIDHMISAEAQGIIGEINGTRPTNPLAKEFTSADLWAMLSMEDTPDQLPTTDFWDEVPRRGRYLET
ncbi:MAG: ABC transporter substrate-binding protein, partial [Geminicoccaceae bacterium]